MGFEEDVLLCGPYTYYSPRCLSLHVRDAARYAIALGYNPTIKHPGKEKGEGQGDDLMWGCKVLLRRVTRGVGVKGGAVLQLPRRRASGSA